MGNREFRLVTEEKSNQELSLISIQRFVEVQTQAYHQSWRLNLLSHLPQRLSLYQLLILLLHQIADLHS
jgi:hypothetical protein